MAVDVSYDIPMQSRERRNVVKNCIEDQQAQDSIFQIIKQVINHILHLINLP